MSRLSGDIYVGDFNNGDLHRLVVNDAGTNITEDRIIHHANNGITDVSKGPGGWLYFLTSSGMHRIVPE
jgi:hypothetical protein